ncbi:hypothetical protein [Mesorhizobium sp. KR9-304]|uniref:hypothetical protein n=1 Tax=Mesorhizobium sp. KR9-304 TaxID=3156614 RepID=UPI0032B5C8EE
MKHPMLARLTDWLIVVLLLAGCSPTIGRTSVDASAYTTMGCNDLNDALANVAKEISRTAIDRGRVARTEIPNWVPGGTRVATAVTDRQTAKIENLQEQERAIAAARDQACARR